MIALTHGALAARIDPLGAQLLSLTHGGDELLWQADPAVWGQTAPVLFPAVGRLRGGGYRHADRWRAMPLHGFATHERFTLRDAGPAHATLALAAAPHLAASYPFDFELVLRFTLGGTGLAVHHRVYNRGAAEPLHFALGAHPGFALAGPLADWQIAFSDAEAPEAWRLAGDLLATRPEPLAWGPGRTLALHGHLFDADALVLRHVHSRRVSLVHRTRGVRLHLHTGGAPHLGLWARPGAPYVCIEPWHGLDDDADAPPDLADKPQYRRLGPGGRFDWCYRIEPAGGAPLAAATPRR